MNALRWISGLAASLAVHVTAGAVLLRALEPQTIPQQPMPESELEVAAYTLERSEARLAQPDPDPAAQEAASGDHLATGAIPASRAKAAEPEAARTKAAQPRANTVRPADTASDALAPSATPATRAPETTMAPQNITNARPDPARAQSATPAVEPLSTGAISSAKLAAQKPEPVATAAAVPSAVAAQAAAPAAEPLEQSRPSVRVAALAQPVLAAAQPTSTDAAPLAELVQKPVETPAATPQPARASAAPLTAVATKPSHPAATTAAPATPKASPTPESIPEAAKIPQAAPRSAPAVTAQPDAAPIRAALAFPSGDEGSVDPVSFAAFQSFMQPGDLSAGTDPVRDGVAGILAQVPCSRLQVGFDPETTTLVVNGHIPDGDLRGSVVAALQAQIGTSIKVSDNMLVLPRPQCEALAGIASVGLAQSTDQFTNPLVIGEDTHARIFRFTEGQLLSLDMTAPDYDAVIYLDYFDADGNVLHLEPNEYAPLRRASAKTAQQIGARRAGDEGLKLVIGPPYGQEIAVAFAASHPLYEGLRPIQEPAGPYLDWLRERVSKARAAHPDFKGEWVYFFVSTSEG